ncbi:MAG: hypothetical protein GEU80_10815 [Dehalococcoidia bacterium]|nr:hypothetical protein [Dehalococcoidia bacterium]
MNQPPTPRGPLAPPEDYRAPVVSDQGTFGTLPPTYEEYDDFEEPTSPRGMGLTLALLGFVVAAALWLGALAVSQTTSPQAALPALERGVAVLSDVEALLTLHQEEMQAEAESVSAPGARVTLPGFPVAGVDFSPEEVTDLDADALRALALERGAARVYEDGTAAFVIEDVAPQEPGIFSTAGGARRVMQFLSQQNHDRASMLVWPAGLAAVLLGALTVVLSRGFRRPLVLGAGLVVAAVPVFVVAGLLRLGVFAIGSDGSAVAEEFAGIAQTLAWAPAEQALIVAATGLALMFPAWVLRSLFDRSARKADERARTLEDWG